MTDYIQYIPDELIIDICRGECIPVVGAGFSKNAILPPGAAMPLWSDLGANVARRGGISTTGNPIKDLTAYCDKCSRFELVRCLWECLHIGTAIPGRAHQEFAKLPFKQVITTNFDFLLELSYRIL